jgi:hypothetical protein
MNRIGVTGASGFVGHAVAAHARNAGLTVIPFSRTPSAEARPFHPGTPADCSGLDALIHLAGESVLGLWTPAKRRRVMESRVLGTRSIVEGIRQASPRPAVLVCASAVGYYGATGGNGATEDSPAGSGFLAEVCRAWEAEAQTAADLGVRVVRVRIGMVLGKGGAMRLMAPVFRAGLGGRLGNGRQWMSPIHVEDVARLMLWAAQSPIEGPLNAVLPDPVRNADFTSQLAGLLHRPAFLPAPAWALRWLLGDLATMLLDSCRVLPSRALAQGYQFRHPSLDASLRAALDLHSPPAQPH